MVEEWARGLPVLVREAPQPQVLFALLFSKISNLCTLNTYVAENQTNGDSGVYSEELTGLGIREIKLQEMW